MIGVHETADRRGYSMQTFTGRLFYPLDPRLDEVCIEDIAHALANICRFGGHAKRFYSVAQHSVLVSQACASSEALWGLLHDAPEAYVGDVIRPIKRLDGMSAYRTAEELVHLAIMAKFRLEPRIPWSVERADHVLLATELRDVMGGALVECCSELASDNLITPWDPETAERSFLQRFEELDVARGRRGQREAP